jgi:hypothetical protein
MKLKTVEIEGKTYAEVQDGKPVFVHDDGKEVATDVAGMASAITARNGEAKAHRERAEAAESKLKQFEGIEDPQAALKALETVQNLDHKKLVDAGEIDKVKGEISKVYDEKLADAEKARSELEKQLNNEMIGGRFSRSKFISEKMAIPADFVQAAFGNNFKIEDGKVVAYDGQGNQVFSKENAGSLADFEEALSTLVDQHPQKDTILKGSGASGGGAQNGGADAGSKTVTRSAFDSMDAKSQDAHLSEGGTVTD